MSALTLFQRVPMGWLSLLCFYFFRDQKPTAVPGSSDSEQSSRAEWKSKSKDPGARQVRSHLGLPRSSVVHQRNDPASQVKPYAKLRTQSLLDLPEGARGSGPHCWGALAGMAAELPSFLGSHLKPQGCMALSPHTLSFIHTKWISTAGFGWKLTVWGLRWRLRGWMTLSGNMGASSS